MGRRLSSLVRLVSLVLLCSAACKTRPNPGANQRTTAAQSTPTSQQRAADRTDSTWNGAQTSNDRASRAAAGSEARPQNSAALHDRGVFDDLSPRVTTQLPPWLSPGPVHSWRSVARPSGRAVFGLVDGVPVVRLTNGANVTFDDSPAAPDADGDGIPDAFDILLGAKKTVLNAAHYKSTYRALDYPGGDVPRDEGVCSDVVVRALRNAGFDLQQLVHEDLKTNPQHYPGVDRPDANIDHRRVRVLLPWFERHWQQLPKDGAASSAIHLPGDVIFFDTLRGPEPDHLGIVTDEVGPSGQPLIINNWTDGYQTSAMDLLATIPVTHRFRVPSARVPVSESERGVGPLLRRHVLQVDPTTRQLVVVVAPTWAHSAGTLRRFQRDTAKQAWKRVGTELEVRLGRSGLGRGRGVHSKEALPTLGDKREGDGRGPAGVFALSTAFGPAAEAPSGVAWPWRRVSKGDVWVDDPKSEFYNRWRHTRDGVSWTSAEDLTMYQLGIVVEHNTAEVLPGFGSAIFLHTSTLERPTAGCTAMPKPQLLELLQWLRVEARPQLVQLAGALFED